MTGKLTDLRKETKEIVDKRKHIKNNNRNPQSTQELKQFQMWQAGCRRGDWEMTGV